MPTQLPLPTALVPLVDHHVAQWRAAAEQAGSELSLSECDDRLMAELRLVLAGSDYVAEQLRRNPGLLQAMRERGDLQRVFEPGELALRLAETLADISSEDELGRALRQFRQYHQVRIIWRDLLRQASTMQTTRDLSDMADACIDQAYRWLYRQGCVSMGTPTGHGGAAQQMVVLGMGKLGAQELNLSSDIDLIFAYPEGGETQGGRRSLSNQEFFIRVGQKLIKALDAPTVDGFVFRVDMRLRPYGDSGALVFSFDALEQYYQDQGRDWERYAMIKARVVAGDQEAGAELLSMLKPFVYRRYLDFAAIEALRSLKLMIKREVQRKGLQDNVKLGSGGIREIEFIGQAFQLIHGGRDRSLQQRPILPVLDMLAAHSYLPDEAVDQLKGAYLFLRDTEHALQAIDDRQTQMLPTDAQTRTRVAHVLGFEGWQAFRETLETHRGHVARHFAGVIADPDEEEGDDAVPFDEWLPLWEGTIDADQALEQLREAGFAQPDEAWRQLGGLLASPQVKAMQRMGRERLDVFMPRLLGLASEQSDPDLALDRVLPLVEAVARRSAYLLLLNENPGALRELLTLCCASPWIAEQITRYPVVLDELLNAGRLYRPPETDELVDELRQQLMRIPEDDLEQQMEALRYFRRAHVLRVAASEIAGSLPLMKVSDYLTWMAEAILQQVLQLAWREMTQRHGLPRRVDGSTCDLDFVVVGYGKVGGIELGHGSDLDLVFIHDGDPDAETDGARPIEGSKFYTRLGQRIIHILNTQTTSGALYDVDMRLRPSGESGLLVSSLTSFARYQREDAWTWEHQALVRARVLVGCKRLGHRFNELRAEVLGRERDEATLRQEVTAMRQKMRDNLATQSTQAGFAASAFEADSLFDLKQDAGGIVDIEFMVQYAVLAWSCRYPELLRYTDNIRILDGLRDAGLIAGEDVQRLQEAYKAYRAAAHRLALQKQPGKVSGDQFHDFRRGVITLWQQWLPEQ
ncbi:bifunctional [glutamate--ammonia ligase]-adenylyl-L-tyrosine phosphorylase/[glutamate--ammonia-ligase] adenylyltransferase [Halopseudomonas nanhaiensis]|uniref:bifunctional [glutamate--ammonia ligase]-adenylyl-L-tyrosine phosphorylase/[glutamate--ammonia-ligase] adenylyltransferase n=1 Tax=Halopseudomonas nanhaiensis TaxID=2830842 RepID=UPI001CBAD916|nr:bifunctional [glutamate--ammonia ligase]-adenylyl-L-tyrosine phosphorylase/[glutamate--ammonia-ligase] adenylyltransferase [Halopseudomonas nanhaiensis]UAW99084.1 bifunctional [glutamate--ammonia ligase]-adenylyl-L-tyrosine phosphorylase/[glutamate--ammonia-ligase] adenylyltransferase [Halopseudomonas nanhaiensis]